RQAEPDEPVRRGLPAVAEDPYTICRSPEIDVIIDVTGSVEFGAHVILEAFAHGKSVVLMNAEVDATIGPILRVYGRKHGQILSACDGDEPGVQMNLVRWVKGLGLIRSEEHTSELQSRGHLVCRLLLEKKNNK